MARKEIHNTTPCVNKHDFVEQKMKAGMEKFSVYFFQRHKNKLCTWILFRIWQDICKRDKPRQLIG